MASKWILETLSVGRDDLTVQPYTLRSLLGLLGAIIAMECCLIALLLIAVSNGVAQLRADKP